MANVLELVNVARTYRGPPLVEALRNATLTAAAGDYIAITGPSGSGKSTLLNILGLLDRPSAGIYRLAGTDTASLSDKRRAGLRAINLGFVFQSFHLLPHRTVLENVMLASTFASVPRGERRRRAKSSLDAVGMSDRLDATPTTLSGGESQRVAIARALANDPAVVLCDEPTGNLDSRNAEVVLDLLRELNEQGQTLIVITHSDRVAAAAQRTVSILDGVLHTDA